MRGDTLRIRIDPPRGFWTLDRFAVDYGEGQTSNVVEIAPRRAVDGTGRNVTSLLADGDGRPYEMPLVGDEVRLEYEVPEQMRGTRRTVFLSTSGYYTYHLDRDTRAQDDLICRLLTKPGEFVRYALNRYVETRAELLAGR